MLKRVFDVLKLISNLINQIIRQMVDENRLIRLVVFEVTQGRAIDSIISQLIVG